MQMNARYLSTKSPVLKCLKLLETGNTHCVFSEVNASEFEQGLQEMSHGSCTIWPSPKGYNTFLHFLLIESMK